MKEKIWLTREQETMLIPLFSKAQENPVLDDPKAREILDKVEYNFSGLKVPQKTVVTLRLRARQIDRFTQAFIDQNPVSLIVHLGCGLDSRCERVNRCESHWIDLDLPDVIDLRRKFFLSDPSYQMVPTSVTDLGWIDQVESGERSVLILAEGLLMYLSEKEVKALIGRLHDAFPGAHLIFDAFSRYTVERIGKHPSLVRTGASIRWGIDDPHDIETWAEGIRLVEEWFFDQSPEVSKLGWYYRLMFRLTGGIPAAKRAQRILYYIL